MKLKLMIIDAFADRPLSGNPAAVCPLDFWLPDDQMQSIAAELNLSETTFFVPEGSEYRIRWFTPLKEVDLVGHATLAAGSLLLDQIDSTVQNVKFVSAGGTLEVRRANDGYVMSMPALKPVAIVAPFSLVNSLGKTPSEVLAAKHYLCVFENAADVAGLIPDMKGLASLDLAAVIVTAPGGGDYDFVSRFFAPANGVPEDPVSGVAHCCLTPYWSERLGRPKLVGRQLSPRGGTVKCHDHGDRVELGGKTAVFLDGWITI
jgi:predicted PhzF superfamily epimerase YddE/YHI9